MFSSVEAISLFLKQSRHNPDLHLHLKDVYFCSVSNKKSFILSKKFVSLISAREMRFRDPGAKQ